MSSKRACQHCGCSEIETDPGRGDAVCTNCGSVLEENIIVSEVQFEENCRGGTSALGQFVSVDGKVPGSRLHGNFSHQLGKESRLITLENGRKKITEIAGQLRLNQHCIDTAFNFYKMMVTRRLTRGRKMSHVIAACVYIVCRTEGTPHMLLDLSDIVQVNVYELGKTYLRLSTALCINIPAIDPCLYIMRFAHKLEFGDKTHEVSMTALRLVQRMKRDWIHTGRRPSGLCGAALLVAARLHDFNRTMQDLIKVVKVGLTTLRNRLTEFGETPTSRLTLEEFMSIDLEEEQDPPCFRAARRKHKLQMLEEQNKVEEVTTEISKVQRMIEKALFKQRKLKGKFGKESIAVDSDEDDDDTENRSIANNNEEADVEEFLMEDTLNMIQSVVEIGNEETVEQVDTHSPTQSTLPEIATSKSLVRGPGPTAASLGLKDSIEECMTIKDNNVEDEGDGELDIAGLDDEELDSYLMSEHEVFRKTQIWNKINADYLEEQKLKEERLAREKEEGTNKPESKKRKKYKKRSNIQANSAGEAIEKMLQEKKISNKINYDVLRNLNCETSLTNMVKTSEEKKQSNMNVESSKNIRFKRRVSFSDSATSASTSKIKKIKEEPKSTTIMEDVKEEEEVKPVVVEDGPVIFEKAPEELDEEEEEEEEDEEEEEEEVETHMSAAQLLRQHAGDEDEEYYSQEEYLD